MKKFLILFIIASFSLTCIARSISDIQQDGAYFRGYDENEFPKMLSHEAQGLPDTFKGSIGIYKITMQLHASASSPSNPDVFPVSGVYKLDEYDPNGKKCGSFILNENSDVQTYITTLVGKMANAKGQTFNVNLTQKQMCSKCEYNFS